MSLFSNVFILFILDYIGKEDRCSSCFRSLRLYFISLIHHTKNTYTMHSMCKTLYRIGEIHWPLWWMWPLPFWGPQSVSIPPESVRLDFISHWGLTKQMPACHHNTILFGFFSWFLQTQMQMLQKPFCGSITLLFFCLLPIKRWLSMLGFGKEERNYLLKSYTGFE